MAVGRITGQMLNSTLNRVTTDLTIRSTGAANLLQIDTSNNRVGIATASNVTELKAQWDTSILGASPYS